MEENLTPREMLENFGSLPKQTAIAFVGAGGKTTCIFELAEECRKLGKSVLVTTTTHMENPCFTGRKGVLSGQAEDILDAAKKEQVVIAGIAGPGGEKMKGLSDEVLEKVRRAFQVILIEADGSKRMPFKVPASHEPVIPSWTTHIVILAGMPALYQPISQACFRLEEARRILGKEFESEMILTPELAGFLLEQGYVGPLKEKCPLIRQMVILNQTRDERIREKLKRNLSVPVYTRPSIELPTHSKIHVIYLESHTSLRDSIEDFVKEKEDAYFCFVFSDRPQPKKSVLERFLESFLKSRKDIGCIAWEGQSNNPLICRKKYLLQFLGQPGDNIEKNILEQPAEDIFCCPIEKE